MRLPCHSTESERMQDVVMDLRIRIDGKNYVASTGMRTGHAFVHLPGEVHRMKWEDKFNCFPEWPQS